MRPRQNPKACQADPSFTIPFNFVPIVRRWQSLFGMRLIGPWGDSTVPHARLVERVLINGMMPDERIFIDIQLLIHPTMNTHASPSVTTPIFRRSGSKYDRKYSDDLG